HDSDVPSRRDLRILRIAGRLTGVAVRVLRDRHRSGSLSIADAPRPNREVWMGIYALDLLLARRHACFRILRLHLTPRRVGTAVHRFLREDEELAVWRAL